MKKFLIFILVSVAYCYAQVEINTTIEDIKNASNDMKEGVTKASENSGNNQEKSSDSNGNSSSDQNKGTNDKQKVDIKAYQNYDFVAGDTIMFEDHFTDGEMGEFPTHWKLIQGQGVVNNIDDENVFVFQQTSIVTPRMKIPSYLTNQYTVEFDFWIARSYSGLNQIRILFDDELSGWTEGKMSIALDNQAFTIIFPDGQLTQNIQDKFSDDQYSDRWHHFAIAVKEKQIKIYLDQYRILTVPDCNYKAGAIGISVNGSDNGVIGFKNFRLAKGGNMNMLGRKFTDTKIVTHGILFDVNKATIKPESMGVINQIYQLLKENADLKFEIGGYTDSDGDDHSNLKLSEARANAVKDQLVSMGIAAERLTSKGYGETNPIDVNTTIEGKANNRRVEFTKK